MTLQRADFLYGLLLELQIRAGELGGAIETDHTSLQNEAARQARILELPGEFTSIQTIPDVGVIPLSPAP